jgi:hypothetical protein
MALRPTTGCSGRRSAAAEPLRWTKNDKTYLEVMPVQWVKANGSSRIETGVAAG